LSPSTNWFLHIWQELMLSLMRIKLEYESAWILLESRIEVRWVMLLQACITSENVPSLTLEYNYWWPLIIAHEVELRSCKAIPCTSVEKLQLAIKAKPLFQQVKLVISLNEDRIDGRFWFSSMRLRNGWRFWRLQNRKEALDGSL
jgi:hypothetical protein